MGAGPHAGRAITATLLARESSSTNVTVSSDVLYTGVFGDTAGVVARCDGTNSNRISFDYTLYTARLRRTIGGSTTVLGSTEYNPASGTEHTLRLECSGNNFKAYIDGALIFDITDDNSLKTNTKIGLLGYYNSTRTTFDNFAAA
jgi:hypothetical protein